MAPRTPGAYIPIEGRIPLFEESRMATTTKSRRRQQRHTVNRDQTAWVEFEHPTPNGRAFRTHLINVSRSGVSFALA